jgi:hypothetical protein
VPFRTIRIIRYLNKESIGRDGLSRYHIMIGGDGLWSVTGVSLVQAKKLMVCRRDLDWVSQIFDKAVHSIRKV